MDLLEDKPGLEQELMEQELMEDIFKDTDLEGIELVLCYSPMVAAGTSLVVHRIMVEVIVRKASIHILVVEEVTHTLVVEEVTHILVAEEVTHTLVVNLVNILTECILLMDTDLEIIELEPEEHSLMVGIVLEEDIGPKVVAYFHITLVAVGILEVGLKVDINLEEGIGLVVDRLDNLVEGLAVDTIVVVPKEVHLDIPMEVHPMVELLAVGSVEAVLTVDTIPMEVLAVDIIPMELHLMVKVLVMDLIEVVHLDIPMEVFHMVFGSNLMELLDLPTEVKIP